MAAYALVGIVAKNAAAPSAPWGVLALRAVLAGVGAGAFTYAAASTRRRWPQLWWLALACAAVLTVVLVALLRPWPPVPSYPAPAGSALAESAGYLSAEKEIPVRGVRILPAARGAGISAAAPKAGDVIAVTDAARGLDRYEAELLLASAYFRAAVYRRSLLYPAALVVFMAAVIAADAVAGGLAKKTHRGPHPISGAFAFAAVFAAGILVATPFLNAARRELLLAADGEAVRRTRKPLAAVELYYKEAAANLLPDRPNPFLHYLTDAEPSPAERAAQARRIRTELAP